MQCPTCKQTMEDGVRFCPNDGTPLTDTAAAPTIAAPTTVHPATVALPLPAIAGGRYRLETLLGGGGMAKVYRSVDLTLEREVAVKLINPELRTDPEFDARFQREARIASQLSDPHIIVVHDFGIDPALGPFLVMEMLHGCSLRDRLHAEGPLPLKAGLQLSAQLMLALIHAHEKGIVHRDIKPDNLFLLNQSGVRLHVRVLDFGIARIYKRDEPSSAETLTAAGAVLGTPRYMSPEQLAGQTVDARSDLYSAALVMHEAITGQLPYVSRKRLTQYCPEAPQALEDLLADCLKPNPAERPPNAVEVYLRLQELSKASGVLLLPAGAMERLAAARQSQPTGLPTSSPRRRLFTSTQGRFVLGMVFLIALLGLLALGKRLFFPSPSLSILRGPESLLGIKIGDSKAEVLKLLTLETEGVLNPWAAKEPPPYLGHVLQPQDLGLDDEQLQHLDVERTLDGRVCILFHDERVVAVIVREGRNATSKGGVGIHSDVGELYALYDLDSQTEPIHIPDGKGGTLRAEVRRYNQLGIGFLIQGKKVTAITLYPAQPAS